MADQAEHASPPSLPIVAPKRVCNNSNTHPVHKSLATAANLANLLPTATVLAFRTLIPSFSNKGSCELSNGCLTAALIGFCAFFCFLSSFSDSFIDTDGNLYYGIATFRGLYVFKTTRMREHLEDDLSKFRISCIDFLHAFVSLFVFLIFAFSDSDVQSCFFPQAGGDVNVLVMNLPLGAGVLSSFLFMIFPTTRRGIGYADVPSLK